MLLCMGVCFLLGYFMRGLALPLAVLMGLMEGPDISSSLQSRIGSLKRSARVSVLLRKPLIIGVGYFFISSINIDQRKLMLV